MFGNRVEPISHLNFSSAPANSSQQPTTCRSLARRFRGSSGATQCVAPLAREGTWRLSERTLAGPNGGSKQVPAHPARRLAIQFSAARQMRTGRFGGVRGRRWYTPAMSAIAERITVHPEQCGGRPCVRGMRIRVSDVLDLFAAGLSPEQILEELPDLEPADLEACLKFASRWLDHPVLVA